MRSNVSFPAVLLCWCCLIVGFVVDVGAAETFDDVAGAADGAIAQRIDELLLQRMHDEDVVPAARADDAEFLRRISLDLAGRIPTVAQTRDFLEDDAEDKRATLIARFLSSPATMNHLAETWRNVMLPANASPELFRNSAGLHSWLREQFSNNMRYDRIVSDLIAATGSEQDGPALFFTALELEPKKIAASTARIFLGLQIECAECHDHPFDDWKQEDFWSYAAFFARMPKNDNMAMSRNFRLDDLSSGEVTLPETENVVAPKFPGGRSPDENDFGSRRQQLSIWMASPDNPYLARAAVNRVWASLFGRGLVNPVDDLGPHNPASHPELLETLTQYFVESRYDINNLLRVLCNTEAYSRTSRVDVSDVPDPALFAAMSVKVQTAEQLYDSLSQCLSQGEATSYVAFGGAPMEAGRQQFLTKMAARTSDALEYDRGLQQALLLMNGNETSEATDLQRSALLTSLEAPFLSDEQRIDILYLATLTRFPTSEEVQRIEQWASDVDDDEGQKTIHADVLWALLNSAEFAMNR